MALLVPLLSLVGTAAAAFDYTVGTSPSNGNIAILEAPISYSIEFGYLADFTGNYSHPNTFTRNLLESLGGISGTIPHIRVGGNSQDFAIYNASQETGSIPIYNESTSQIGTETIGPSFFESFHTVPGVRWTYGFNMGDALTAEGWQSLAETIPLACKALEPDSDGRPRLDHWEYGNEADLYGNTGTPHRLTNWTYEAYEEQYRNGTAFIQKLVSQHCPTLSTKFLGPSLGFETQVLNLTKIWALGLDDGDIIGLFSSHNYISSSLSKGVTLQGTLLNHSKIVQSLKVKTDEYVALFGDEKTVSASRPRHVFGETNSLSSHGRGGLSNTLGAGLWAANWALYATSQNYGRLHFHMGTGYPYASWQGVDSINGTKGTKAPFYGNVAATAALGATAKHDTVVANLNPDNATVDATYAIYEDGQLVRVFILNMREYNTTVDGLGLEPLPSVPERPVRTYTFHLDGSIPRYGSRQQEVRVQRLHSKGSDAISGITWDGYSYNLELAEGKPVRLNNVTVGETVKIKDGKVSVQVPDGSAALLNF